MSLTSANLLKKYDVPGPRYTSYPVILHWDEKPTDDEWIRSIAQSLESSERNGKGAAIYIHIPFCKSLCTYCGCNTRTTQSTKAGTKYVKSVLKEWEIYLKHLSRTEKIPLSELHLGGGTPTYLAPSELEELLTGILKDTHRTKDSEFSIEVDPRVTSKEHLETLAKLGFTRLSVGVQDFDPKVQQSINRVQSEEEVRTVTEEARALGFKSVNYDLVYGLPFQTKESILNTIETVMRLRPDRIALYAYAHVPWVKPGQRHFTEEDLPKGDEKRALYELGRSLLEEAGYSEIGMDHFALSTDSLSQATTNGNLHRNFMGYTSRQVSPLIGLGVSSISDSWNMFMQNEKTVEAYTEKVEKGELPFLRGHVLSDEDRVLRRHILNLMTSFKTDWASKDSYVPYLETVPDKLEEVEHDGFIKLENKHCEITEKGKPFLRNICMAFDARLERNTPTTRLFSQTI